VRDILDPSSYLTFDSQQIGGDSSLLNGADSSLIGRSDFNESNNYPAKMPKSQSKPSRGSSKAMIQKSSTD